MTLFIGGSHIYPTKKFDNEQRLIEHCLRHARVQSQMMLREDIMGAIGWCAFDYNTHSDFASGDKICYHGVMDMYRIPKFASYVYKSQLSPTKEVVLEPVTYFSRGEKDRGAVAPVVVMTNCDYVELVIGGSIAFWIKTKANLQAGRAKITVKSLNTMIVDKVLDINIK